jgi:hypothetical protein
MVMPSGTQAFCGTDGCDVLMWNPTDKPEVFKAKAQVIESHVDPATGGITWKPGNREES